MLIETPCFSVYSPYILSDNICRFLFLQETWSIIKFAIDDQSNDYSYFQNVIPWALPMSAR